MDKKYQELIWKYIDGQCTIDETTEVEILSHSNPRFKEHLDDAMQIHGALQLTTISETPFDLSSIVLDRLSGATNKKVYSDIGMTPLYIFLAITFIFSFLTKNVTLPFTFQFDRLIEQYFLYYIPSFNISIPVSDQYIFLIICSLIIVPFLYFLDKLLFGRKNLKTGQLLFLY